MGFFSPDDPIVRVKLWEANAIPEGLYFRIFNYSLPLWDWTLSIPKMVHLKPIAK